jgi:hypothetical protein
MSREEDEHEAVGYKKPPKHSRFQKGQSGNPSGRRKAKPRLNILDVLDQVLAEQIRMTKKSGETRKVSYLYGVVRQTVESAAKGEASARRDLIKLALCSAARRQDDAADPLTEEEEARILARFIARERRAGGGCDD